MPAPILTAKEMRVWEEASWAAGRQPGIVIAEVGRQLGGLATRLIPGLSRVLLLCGKGHNGDDGRASLQRLKGLDTEVVNLSDPVSQLKSVKDGLGRRPQLIIDALFGIGLNRPLEPAWTAVIEAVRASGIPVLSVDVPSGLSADTGLPLGDAIRATWTATLGAPKKGLVEFWARPYVGRLLVLPEIGLVPRSRGPRVAWWTLPGDFGGYPRVRDVESHKGTFGHVGVIAGSLGYHGAAVLAAKGAARATPGLITVLTQPSVYVPVASQLSSAMVKPWRGGDWEALKRFTAVVAGPGLAAEDVSNKLRMQVCELWLGAQIPVVVDASALAWLPSGPLNTEVPRVITPHPGEAARLLGCSVNQIQEDRFGAVQQLSKKFGGCWVVLKGAQTLVGSGEGPWFINSSGNPGMGQGGSGDLLAGFIGGLAAQPALVSGDEAGAGNSPLDDAPFNPMLRLLNYAVWEHGAAADRLAEQRAGWTIEDLSVELGRVRIGPV